MARASFSRARWSGVSGSPPRRSIVRSPSGSFATTPSSPTRAMCSPGEVVEWGTR
ncbi:Uncharacterised protein [Mycobacteroides abscessus subsp. abscessus]|nr:Uncharacterised protein [Mycobacteroides abscessus subsp. abscessus]